MSATLTTQTLIEIIDSLSLKDLKSELAQWTDKTNEACRIYSIAKSYQDLYRLAIRYKEAKENSEQDVNL